MQDEKINKIAQMRKHIAACKESGLQVKQYCKEQKLKRSAYYYWCKKLQTDLQLQLILQGIILQSVRHKKRFSIKA